MSSHGKSFSVVNATGSVSRDVKDCERLWKLCAVKVSLGFLALLRGEVYSISENGMKRERKEGNNVYSSASERVAVCILTSS